MILRAGWAEKSSGPVKDHKPTKSSTPCKQKDLMVAKKETTITSIYIFIDSTHMMLGLNTPHFTKHERNTSGISMNLPNLLVSSPHPFPVAKCLP